MKGKTKQQAFLPVGVNPPNNYRKEITKMVIKRFTIPLLVTLLLSLNPAAFSRTAVWQQTSTQTQALANGLSNEDVLRLVRARLGEEMIILKIKQSQTNLDTSPEALIKLKHDAQSASNQEAAARNAEDLSEKVPTVTPLRTDEAKPSNEKVETGYAGKEAEAAATPSEQTPAQRAIINLPIGSAWKGEGRQRFDSAQWWRSYSLSSSFLAGSPASRNGAEATTANLRKQLAAELSNRLSHSTSATDPKISSRYSPPTLPQPSSRSSVKMGPLITALAGLGLVGAGAYLIATQKKPQTIGELVDPGHDNRFRYGTAMVILGGTLAIAGFWQMR